MLLYGVRETPDNLKKILWKSHPDIKGAGKMSIKTTFKTPEKTVVEIDDESIPKYITYMSKGKYDPSYYKSYDETFMSDCKSAWINHRRMSKDTILYEDFAALLKEKEKEFGKLIRTLADVKPYALAYCRNKHGVINWQCKKDISMVISTWMYDYGETSYEIQIPFV